MSGARIALILVAVALAAAYTLSTIGTAPAPDTSADAAGVGAVERARLRALGYLGWHEEAPESLATSGVTVHRSDRVVPGLNVYCSEPSGVLRFMGMDGSEVHSIDLGMDEAADPDNYCKRVVPSGNDALVALFENTKLVKLGLDGTVHWALHRAFHHDVYVAADGRIVAVANVPATVAAYPTERPLTDNVIVILDPHGGFLQTFSMAALVADAPALLARARAHLDDPYPYWEDAAEADADGAPGDAAARREWRRHDPFHVNTVALLPRPIALPDGGEAPAGAILFCARNLDSIGIIDPARERIVWHWGIGELQWPHHPSLLASGRILLFDNGVARGQSRLLELDPVRRTPTWRYEPGPTFFSRSRGSAERLSAGHTLITESSRGRVFEIDADGEIVWEFLNPQTLPEQNRRATIFRMTRLAPETVRAMDWPPAPRARLAELGLLPPHGR